MLDEKTLTSKPLSAEELRQLNAYWRAANYLTACQLYLLDNPLLRRPLTAAETALLEWEISVQD